jgi:hypothetical protein
LFFLSFFFCQVWLQQKSILFGLLKVSQAHLELAAGGVVDVPTGQAGRLAGCGLVGQQASGGQWWPWSGSPPVLSVYCGMEKPSMG